MASQQTSANKPQSSTTDTTNNATTSGPGAGEKSLNQMVREAGFESFNRFMQSYGLKVWEPEDVEEGKAILKAMFQSEKGSG